MTHVCIVHTFVMSVQDRHTPVPVCRVYSTVYHNIADLHFCHICTIHTLHVHTCHILGVTIRQVGLQSCLYSGTKEHKLFGGTHLCHVYSNISHQTVEHCCRICVWNRHRFGAQRPAPHLPIPKYALLCVGDGATVWDRPWRDTRPLHELLLCMTKPSRPGMGPVRSISI